MKSGIKGDVLINHTKLRLDQSSRTGVKSNYLEWLKANEYDIQAAHGQCGEVLTTHALINSQPLMTRAECNALAGSIITGKTLHIDHLKDVIKERKTNVGIYIKVFAWIMSKTSEESKCAIELHADYKAAKDAGNPADLMKIIKSIHYLSAQTDVKLRANELLSIEETLNDLRMESRESLEAFYVRYKHAIERFEAAGGSKKTDYDKGVSYVRKLDPIRWESMFLDIERKRARNDPDAYPDNLDASHSMASRWMVITQPKEIVAATKETFCVTKEELQRMIAEAVSNSKSGVKKERLPANTCDCGKGGGRHHPDNCWTKHPDKKPKDKKEKSEGNYFMSPIGYDDPEDAIDEHEKLLTTVAVCQIENPTEFFRVGVNSDDNVKGIIASVLEETRVHQLAQTALGVCATPLIGDTDVLLDNGAERSLFRNANLLTDLRPSMRPVLLKGITAGDAGLRIDTDGTVAFLRGKNPHTASYHSGASVNVLGYSSLKDDGYSVVAHDEEDCFVVDGHLKFERRRLANGALSKHYICNVAQAMGGVEVQVPFESVRDNMQSYSRREVDTAIAAKEFQRRLGFASASSAAAVVRGGGTIRISDTPITLDSIKTAEAIFGPQVAQLKASTIKRKARGHGSIVAPRLVQTPQTLHLDKFQIKEISFLIGVSDPLGLIMCAHLKDESAAVTLACVQLFQSTLRRRSFDTTGIRIDPGSELVAMKTTLESASCPVDVASPGHHVPVAERTIRTVKERVRGHENSLPYVMCKTLLVMCVLFCVSMLNLQPRQAILSCISPQEMYSGSKLDTARDMRFGFGDYCQATQPNTDNTMRARTQGCIMGIPAGNRTGGVIMLSLSTWELVTRQHFTILPMPDIVMDHLNKRAERDNMARGGTVTNSRGQSQDEPLEHPSRARMPLYDRVDQPQDYAAQLAQAAGVDLQSNVVPVPTNDRLRPRRSPRFEDQFSLADDHLASQSVLSVPDELDDSYNPTEIGGGDDFPQRLGGGSGDIDTQAESFQSETLEEDLRQSEVPTPRRSIRSNKGIPAVRFGYELSFSEELISTYYAQESYGEVTGCEERDIMAHCLDVECIQRQLDRRRNWKDSELALTMSVKAALRERGADAMPAILKELQQMVDREVWHPVFLDSLTSAKRSAVIRSSMFLRDKYKPTGEFEKFKARLVAGGDQQEKGLYTDLSSPTVATQLVLTIAAIAANEGRIVESADIGGAFLNAEMKASGVKVHVRLDRLMTQLLLKIAPHYLPYVTADGTLVVELDKALYGCVESAKLWHNHLTNQLVEYGLTPNPYDKCVFNLGKGDDQMTIALHVDDLLITCKSQAIIDKFMTHLESLYGGDITRHRGKKIDYVGMSFDFTAEGQVSITMANMVADLLQGYDNIGHRATPATSTLFEVRDAPKLNEVAAKLFHTKTAQALYLSKRARPDCLTAVAFLTTRVQAPDVDDEAKLRRLLGYISATSDRGLTLRIGGKIQVTVYIDAAYGVHSESGKSHTGAIVIIGEGGAVYARSTKQKIVVKSSTEAELVGLSDSLGEALYIANFLRAQGYTLEPVTVYQDNTSCISLVKKGGPCSERSKHLDIRRFWMSDRWEKKDIDIVHKDTKAMWANLLTKPLQGEQYILERFGVTNWGQIPD